MNSSQKKEVSKRIKYVTGQLTAINKMIAERKESSDIFVQLARYCAKKNNSPNWNLKVIGNRSQATLGEMGPAGLVIQ